MKTLTNPVINEAALDVLNKLKSDKPAAVMPVVAAVADEAPAPFAFNQNLDKAGLPLEHAAYVKKNCKVCFGRGYQVALVGDGYLPKASGKAREPRKARTYQLCGCLHKGYSRARLKLQEEIAEMVKAYGGDEKQLADQAAKSMRQTMGVDSPLELPATGPRNE